MYPYMYNEYYYCIIGARSVAIAGRYGWEGLGGGGWVAGLVLEVIFKIGEIKIASSDNSGARGGVVELSCVEP